MSNCIYYFYIITIYADLNNMKIYMHTEIQ